tara:strand:- start:255 stop:419 length:165 start_codon:yes stop_codon:yes gene_type:complete
MPTQHWISIPTSLYGKGVSLKEHLTAVDGVGLKTNGQETSILFIRNVIQLQSVA